MADPPRAGGSRPLGVFVHGYSCTRAHWAEAASRLEGVLDPLLLSLPGHDDTPLPSGRLDVASCARSVNEAVAATGREGALLIGHSLGGMVGMKSVRDRPQLYRGLVLVDAFVRLGAPEPFGSSFWDGSPPGLKSSIIRGMMDARRKLPSTLWESVVRFDGEPLLAEVETPVRGIYGDRGEVDHASLEKLLRGTGLARARDVELRIVGQAGHFVMLEQPEPFCETLADLMDGLAGR